MHCVLAKRKALLHGGCDWFKPALNLPFLPCSIHMLNRSSKKNWSVMLKLFICILAGVSTRLCLIYLIGSFFRSLNVKKYANAMSQGYQIVNIKVAAGSPQSPK